MFEIGNAFTLYQDPLADAIVQSPTYRLELVIL
jgi:hypothetical protein